MKTINRYKRTQIQSVGTAIVILALPAFYKWPFVTALLSFAAAVSTIALRHLAMRAGQGRTLGTSADRDGMKYLVPGRKYHTIEPFRLVIQASRTSIGTLHDSVEGERVYILPFRPDEIPMDFVYDEFDRNRPFREE